MDNGTGEETPMESGKAVVVIGSGFGGLAMAIRLQAAGLQVTVLEKREKIGGRAYQLKDKGYVFDMGPSLITAPHVIDSVFKAAGRRLQDYVDLVPLDPYYRVYYHDGTHLDYVGDPDKMKSQMAASGMDDSILNRQLAIISSMTKKERAKPALLNASRKKRVAAGSGTQVQDVNKLLKMHRQMSDRMKKLGRQKGGLAGMFGGGAPQMPDEAALDSMRHGGMGGALPGSMPGLGRGLPRLPGMGKGPKIKK